MFTTLNLFTHNAGVRRLPQGVCLVAACILGCHPVTYAQLSDPHEMPVAQAVLQCPPPVRFSDRQIAPRIVIADLTFEGSTGIAIANRDQIAASLKQRSYPDDRDGVGSDVEEIVRRAWQEHGYFNVRVRGDTTILTSSPLESRVAVTLQVDEGQQYRLSGITFKNNRAISNEQVLRSLFAIQDGDLFNVAEVGKGLENLRALYGQFGYINFTPVPDAQVNDMSQTISLEVDLDEGKQFYVSSINTAGIDERDSQDALKGFLLKPGDIYNQRLLDLSTERLSARRSGVFAEWQQDETAGTVAITIGSRHCSAK
jgi:outer membrane protein assembly factor BamA